MNQLLMYFETLCSEEKSWLKMSMNLKITWQILCKIHLRLSDSTPGEEDGGSQTLQSQVTVFSHRKIGELFGGLYISFSCSKQHDIWDISMFYVFYGPSFFGITFDQSD